MAMELIETIELGSAASSVQFSGIPSTGTHLILHISARQVGGNNAYGYIRFNGASASSAFFDRFMYGQSTTVATSYSNTDISAVITNYASAASNTYSNTKLLISNYANSLPSTKMISAEGVSEDDTSYVNRLQVTAGAWSPASAITSIELTLPATSYEAGSTFSLYTLT